MKIEQGTVTVENGLTIREYLVNSEGCFNISNTASETFFVYDGGARLYEFDPSDPLNPKKTDTQHEDTFLFGKIMTPRDCLDKEGKAAEFDTHIAVPSSKRYDCWYRNKEGVVVSEERGIHHLGGIPHRLEKGDDGVNTFTNLYTDEVFNCSYPPKEEGVAFRSIEFFLLDDELFSLETSYNNGARKADLYRFRYDGSIHVREELPMTNYGTEIRAVSGKGYIAIRTRKEMFGTEHTLHIITH